MTKNIDWSKDEARVTWGAEKIDVGNLEAGVELAGDYDLVINLNDAFNPATTIWFPINEVSPWGYAPFFFIKRMLDHAGPEKKILLHCAAGACRSPMMLYCYLLSKGETGASIEEKYGGKYNTLYDMMVRRGHIPADLLRFYALMDQHPTNSLMGVLARMDKPESH